MHGRMLGGLLHVGTRTPRIIFSCGAMALLREAARGPSRLAMPAQMHGTPEIRGFATETRTI